MTDPLHGLVACHTTRDTCRVNAWYDRRACAGLAETAMALLRSPIQETAAAPQGGAVLRVLIESWERAVAALNMPNRSDCQAAARDCAEAPRRALEMLETALRQAGSGMP